MALLELRGIAKSFGHTKAVAPLIDINLDVDAGQTVGLMGRSGSGKSTLAAIMARLQEADAGTIRFDGAMLTQARNRQGAANAWRARIQMVFQDSKGSLDPLMRCGDTIAMPWRNRRESLALIGKRAARDRNRAAVEALATQLSLPLAVLDKLPHQLSGGQATRIAIARALASAPDLLILDEPTAALDVCVQAELLKTLDSLRRTRGLTMLLISHDRDLIRLFCDRAVELASGRLNEIPLPSDI